MNKQAAQLKSFTRMLCRFVFSVFLLSTIILSSPASAQTRASILDRLDSMEAQLDAMRNGAGAPPVARGGASLTGTARFEVAITEMEEELRLMRGKIEEMEYQQQRVTEEFDRLQKDVDLRFSELEAARSAPVIGNEPEMDSPASAERVQDQSSDDASARSGEPAAVYDSAREHYDDAFKMLNQGDYAMAADLFASFVERFPKDNLVGNAYYWLGETHYVKQEYQQAAKQFRSGFQKMPNGAKAPDNLLKLAMSLGTLERKKEACVVLKQLITKYADQSRAVKRKAMQENARLQCQ